MAIYKKISDAIHKVMCVFAAVILGVMTIVFFVNILQRYIVGSGFHGNEEITRYCMIWLVFVCGVILTKLDEHLNISVLEDLLKGKARKTLKLIQRLIMLIFYSIMTYISIGFVRVGAKQVSPNLGVPMNIVYLIFPVAFILMIVQVVYVILTDILPQNETSQLQKQSNHEGGET